MPELTFLAFPQSWDGGDAIRLRILALPRTNPLAPLVPGAPAFAQTDLALEARVVPGLADLPKLAAALPPFTLDVPASPRRLALFEHLAGRFDIQPAPPPPAIPPAPVRIQKALTTSYQSAAGITHPRTEFLLADGSYRCALEEPPAPEPLPEIPASVTWGQLLAWVLRQPRILEELGILFETTIQVPERALANGGWLFRSPGGRKPLLRSPHSRRCRFLRGSHPATPGFPPASLRGSLVADHKRRGRRLRCSLPGSGGLLGWLRQDRSRRSTSQFRRGRHRARRAPARPRSRHSSGLG